MRSFVRVGEGLARLRGSVFVVVSEIAVFTQTLGIVRLARVRAEPRLLSSSLPVVTVDAHALCIVSLIRVGAIGDLSLAQIVVGAEDFRHDFCLVWLSGSYLKFGSFLSNLILLSVLINIIADVTLHHLLLGKSLVKRLLKLMIIVVTLIDIGDREILNNSQIFFKLFLLDRLWTLTQRMIESHEIDLFLEG